MFTIQSLFQESWQLFKAKYGLLLGAAATVAGIEVASEIVYTVMTVLVPFYETPDEIYGLGDIFSFLSNFLITPVLQLGVLYVAVQAYRKQDVSVSSVFAGFSQYGRIVAVTILLALAGILALVLLALISFTPTLLISSEELGLIAAVLLLLPGLLVLSILFTRLAYAVVFICFETRCSVIECFGESWRRTRDVYWTIIGANILIGLIALASILAFLLPFFFFWVPFATAFYGVVVAKLMEDQSSSDKMAGTLELPENPAFRGPNNG
ncbi:MAG: hypothetical protein VX126_02715 [Planctomycetota bacterium]|nr:hypothetical protein [Planctomycetota bacterium]